MNQYRIAQRLLQTYMYELSIRTYYTVYVGLDYDNMFYSTFMLNTEI